LSPSRTSPTLLGLLLVASATPARAEARLEVSGEVVGRAPRLEVRVLVSNRGDQAATPLTVVGELLGERREARLVRGVGPGAAEAVVLDFAPSPPRAGSHALTLLLEHPVDGGLDAAGNPPMASQRAYLLLALGARPDPAVRIEVASASIDVFGELPVRLLSADGDAHRVAVRALTARGLRVVESPEAVEVPAAGAVTLSFRLARAGAPRGTHHGVLVVAETVDGPLARTSVATAPVDVVPDPSLLPRLRGPILFVAILLLSAAALAEWRRRRAVVPASRGGGAPSAARET
jgi:hypothetical protein